jgi:D-alanyl-lipoteichoic acid acyltransferase DltB (MBOAT superfamily)
MLVAVPLHWMLPHRYRPWMLAAFSVLFYSMWRWEFSFLMVFSAVVDFVSSKRIHRSETPRVRRAWLVLSLCVNLGLLVFFKYTYFIYGNVQLLGQTVGYSLPDIGIRIILPLGISFYTFQTISYTIDVYRRVTKPTHDFVVFLAYVTFWPQLIAGPILRSGEIIPQILSERRASADNLSAGVHRITKGLFKKVFIADNLAPIVDASFATDPTLASAFDVWSMTILFGFQIYFDFAGYSDIAIGSARILGFRFPENFKFPYMALSPRDFWKRWHISLSSWIRDYLYLPLMKQPFMTSSEGGITPTEKRSGMTAFNGLFLTWIIMGFWHGSYWTFAVWGLYHATAIFVYRKVKFLNVLARKVPVLAWGIMFLVAMAGWIPFRSQSLSQTVTLFSKIVDPRQYYLTFVTTHGFNVFAIFAILVGMLSAYWFHSNPPQRQSARVLTHVLSACSIAVMAFFIFVYMKTNEQFIYFQF